MMISHKSIYDALHEQTLTFTLSFWTYICMLARDSIVKTLFTIVGHYCIFKFYRRGLKLLTIIKGTATWNYCTLGSCKLAPLIMIVLNQRLITEAANAAYNRKNCKKWTYLFSSRKRYLIHQPFCTCNVEFN